MAVALVLLLAGEEMSAHGWSSHYHPSRMQIGKAENSCDITSSRWNTSVLKGAILRTMNVGGHYRFDGVLDEFHMHD